MAVSLPDGVIGVRWDDEYGAGAAGTARPGVPPRLPGLRVDRAARRAARHRIRAAGPGRPRLPRLRRRRRSTPSRRRGATWRCSRTGVFGNPHSGSPAAAASTELAARARRQVLARHFHASPDEYAVIFTANASGALRLVGESYPFHGGGHLLLPADNHNSVNGIREFAGRAGRPVTYVPLTLPDLRVDDVRARPAPRPGAAPPAGTCSPIPRSRTSRGCSTRSPGSSRAHARGWDVLLDAAAFAPTNELDLGRHQPDYVDLSFYKMFGYPTGVGCLLARRDALVRLRRPWFAGGTDRGGVGAGAPPLPRPRGRRGSRTAPSTTSACPRWRSACGTSSRSVSRRSTARALPDRMAAAIACSPSATGTASRWLRLYGPPPTRRAAARGPELLDAEGRCSTTGRSSAAPRPTHLAAHRVLLQPGQRGDRVRDHGRRGLRLLRRDPGARLTARRVRPVPRGEPSGAVRVSLGLASNFADVERFWSSRKGCGSPDLHPVTRRSHPPVEVVALVRDLVVGDELDRPGVSKPVARNVSAPGRSRSILAATRSSGPIQPGTRIERSTCRPTFVRSR